MNIIYYFLTTLLFLSCNEEKTKTVSFSSNQRDSSKIVLIFNSAPNMSNKQTIGGIRFIYTKEPTIKIWDNFKSQTIQPNIGHTDTIIIVPRGKLILLQHGYNYVNSSDITLIPGDIVNINYKSDTPYFQILNRETKYYDLRFDSIKNESIYKGKVFTSYQKYNYPELNYVNAKQLDFFKMQQDKIESGESAVIELKSELKLLDSIKAGNLISQNDYDIHFDNLLFSIYSLQFSLSQINKQKCLEIIDSMKTSSFSMPYSYSLNFCELYSRNTFEAKAPILKSSNGSIVDFRKVYDLLEESTIFPKRIKELLLYKYLNEIAKNFSISDFKIYTRKFQTSVKDTFLNNNITTAYFLDYDKLSVVSDSVYLLNSNKSKSTLESILKNKKGKVIFIDLWASWCAPCIKFLPNSKALINKYSPNEFEVLFLSIDKNYEDWRKMSEKLGILNYPNSFLVINPETAEYLKLLKLSAIPRYLLYDKNGVLINSTASDPQSKILLQDINKLLQSK